MSKPYRIAIAETVRRHIVVEDGVETRLDLLGILPHDDMSALLEAELAKIGFEVANGLATRTDADGVTIRVETKTRKITISMREESEVEQTTNRVFASDHQAPTEGMRKAVKAEAEAELDAVQERQRRVITEALEKKLGDVREELDRVAVVVTQEALRRRASQIGQIESIEQDASGSMTIRVRV